MRFIKSFMITALLLVVCHIQAQKVWDGTCAVGFESGMGTKDSPYEIQTPEQFAFFINAINHGETFFGKEIVMTRDICLNNLALGAKENTTFSGTFNGLGHYIYDMYCMENYDAHMFYNLEGAISNLSVQGKFYSTWISSFIENIKPLGIIYHCNFEINMNVETDDGLAIIAGYNNGCIVDCKTSGNITCSKGHSGRYIDYDDGEYLGAVYSNTGTLIPDTKQAEMEEWLAQHTYITKTAFEYTQPTCTVEITDPEGVVVAPDIIVRNGLTFGGFNYPTTGFDCTVTGYKWRGKNVNSNAFIEREYVNLYPVYKRTIKEQPTSERPTIVVDDKAHALYNWYKVCPGSIWYDDFNYGGNATVDSKTYNINAEEGDSLTFDYNIEGAQNSDYLKITLNNQTILMYSGKQSSHFMYYFSAAGTYSMQVSVIKTSNCDVEASVTNIRVSKSEDVLAEKNAYPTLNVNNKNIEDGESYYCVVSYSNSPTVLRSNSFVVRKDAGKPDTDISGIANTLYCDNLEALSGKTIELPIRMKNEVSVTGFQFDLHLPSDITVVQDEDGFCDVVLSNERTTASKTNTFDSALMPDGTLRVLAASTRNYAFEGNDGVVCVIRLSIGQNLPEGDYPIVMKNIELTNASGQTWNVDNLKRTISVKNYKLGDANGDGRVSVGDFSAIASHIMGGMPDGFVALAADANEDNNISVGDLSTVASMIMSEETSNAHAAMPRAKAKVECTDISNLENVIYADPVVVSQGGDATIIFNMKNYIPVTGFQFDFILPEGFYVTQDEDGFLDAELSTSRTTPKKTNTFECGKMSDGSYRVLAASTRNYEFSGNDGEVVQVHIMKADGMESGDYTLTIRNIELTNASGETFNTDKVLTSISVPTATKEMALMDGDVYSNSVTATYEKITYTRTFSEASVDNWEALYVPISIDVREYDGELDFAEIYAFCATIDTNCDGIVNADDENFFFIRPVRTGVIKPNVPYLVRPHEAKTYVIASADNVLYKAAEGRVEFSTTIDKFTVTGLNEEFILREGDNNYYVSESNELAYCMTDGTSIKPNRWIMHRESKEYGGTAIPVAINKAYRIITFGEENSVITDIEAFRMTDSIEEDGKTFTIDGIEIHSLQNLHRGIYIHNGKKHIVK